jgi:hypothetical protein
MLSGNNDYEYPKNIPKQRLRDASEIPRHGPTARVVGASTDRHRQQSERNRPTTIESVRSVITVPSRQIDLDKNG